MDIRDYIQRRFRERLHASPVLVVYDPEKRYAGIVAGLADKHTTVVDGSASTILAREQAMAAWREVGEDKSERRRLLVCLPIAKPETREGQQIDPYSVFRIGGGVFPDTDGDSYHSLCRLAKPDMVGQVDQLFAAGVPDFDTVDAIGGGSGWPRLRSLLHAQSAAEILVALLAPTADQRKQLQQDEAWQTECQEFCQAVLGLVWKTKSSKWSLIRDELARYILFSEFAFDLPDPALPATLASVPCAPATARQLVYSVCDGLRNSLVTENAYVDLAKEVEKDLKIEHHTRDIADLGVRDTFSFEERTFLKRFAKAAAADDLGTAQSIVDSRKTSIWVRMDATRQLQWTVAERGVGLLRRVQDLAPEVPKNAKSLGGLIRFYCARLLEVDDLQRGFEQAVGDLCGELSPLDALVAGARASYRALAESTQKSFTGFVEGQGWPADGITRHTDVFEKFVAPHVANRRRTALVMVDALRYELGAALHAQLAESFQAKLETVCGQLPSATPVGMAALLPEASARLELKAVGDSLVPTLAGKPVVVPSDRLDYVRSIYGDRAAMVGMADLLMPGKLSMADTVHLLLVKTDDIDFTGESHPQLVSANLATNLKHIIAAVRKLAQAGFERVVIATDHGFVLWPEAQPGDTIQKPDGTWLLTKRRCLVGAGSSSPGVLLLTTEHAGIRTSAAEHYATPRTYATFSSGKRYFHEGLSLQECVLPVICVDLVKDHPEETAMPLELVLSYKGGRKKITSRRPMIEISLTAGFFVKELKFAFHAIDEGKKIVGEPAACEHVDGTTDLVVVQAGQPIKIPLRMADDFEGSFEVQAFDPETLLVYDRLKLKTDYLE